MAISASLIRKLDRFPEDLREVFLAIIDELEAYRHMTVTKVDFADLKAVVADLAASVRDLSEAQKRTEQKVFELAEAQKRTEERLNELAEAQKRTEQRVNELAEAQKRTEERLNELAEAQKRTEAAVGALATAQKATRDHVGGLSRSLAYALEIEAYRKLPAYLNKVHGIRVMETLIRTEVAEEEVNFWAKALKNGQEVRLVGECVLRLDDASKLKALRRKLQKIGRIVSAELVPILVTHYATPKLLQQATEKGILVVHSYQWDQDF